ncbi:MAG: DNA translocase FtsK 4TM domain-containing protein [candidate division Zixibacteria bacterium]|nr:DNA translocase FtsK 4TM domain-containing protein [candidate division Zixibacteria bacterium]
MARRKSSSSGGRWRKVVGGLVFIVAVLILIALATHSGFDDARIKGERGTNLDPFEIPYRNQGGMIGAYLSFSLMVVAGWLSFFLPFGLILVSLRLFSSELAARLRLSGLIAFAIAVLGTTLYNVPRLASATLVADSGAIGGYLMLKLTNLLIKVLGTLGTYVVCGGIIVVLLIAFTSVHRLLSTQMSWPSLGFLGRAGGALKSWLKWLFGFEWLAGSERENADGEEADDDQPGDSDNAPERVESAEEADLDTAKEPGATIDRQSGRQKTTLKRAPEKVQVESIVYEYPTLDLLNDPPADAPTVTDEELQTTARMLKETLETFQVTVEGPISSHPGPIITRFEFKPGIGVKVNRIVGLADDLALALKAKRIRIVAPIPGKAAVGVEIPNRQPQSVYLKEILSSTEYNDPRIRLPLTLGKTINGKPFVTDLARMPHLLIAGATGSGKSVCMNALITSLIYKLHPLHIRFVFIDPKMLELSVYAKIPHMGRPVVTSPKRAEQVLSDIVVEMEKRYRKLAEAGVRNIEDFNKRQKKEEEKLPYIVVCVDELADLMMSATSSKVETLITRLAQMARAVGIHLVLATQRPSVDVITGLIKANFPARIAFQVASKVDSRTIIDANGAEKLLGAGDMLFLSTGQPEPVRLHGAYISSEETDRLVEFISGQGLEMMALNGVSQSSSDSTEAEVDLGDPLFREACEVVVRHKQGSVSLLQRRLGVGYQRAARLIDKLEQAGVVSRFDGSKAREVIVDQAFIDVMFSGRAGQPVDKSK